MRKNICLILMPSENSVYKKKMPTIPPISLGVLAGYLTKNGIEVFIEDCANKINLDNNIETQKSIFEAVFDKDAIFNYLEGKNDLLSIEELEREQCQELFQNYEKRGADRY